MYTALHCTPHRPLPFLAISKNLIQTHHGSTTCTCRRCSAAPAAPARPQPAALARPVVLPPELSGTSGADFPTFLAQFDAACAVNGYGQADRLQFLPCRLQGVGLPSVPSGAPSPTSHHVCADVPRTVCSVQSSSAIAASRGRVPRRKKLATETQVQLAADLQRIAARAFPGQQGTPLFERLLLNRFIDGQGSPELRLHIRSAAPADLDAGVRQALEMSAILE